MSLDHRMTECQLVVAEALILVGSILHRYIKTSTSCNHWGGGMIRREGWKEIVADLPMTHASCYSSCIMLLGLTNLIF